MTISRAVIGELSPLPQKLIMLLAYPIDPEVTPREALLKASNVTKERINTLPAYTGIGIQDVLGSD